LSRFAFSAGRQNPHPDSGASQNLGHPLAQRARAGRRALASYRCQMIRVSSSGIATLSQCGTTRAV
jgi:hypothetical protein